MKRWLLALPLLASCVDVLAASVYKCRTQAGEVYQNTPCSITQEQLDRIDYRPVPDSPPDVAQTMPDAAAAPTMSQPTLVAPEPVAMYECTVEAVTWLQPAPCPVSEPRFTTHTAPTYVPQSNSYVNVTSTTRSETPVRQVELTRAQACRRILDGVKTSRHSSSADDAYERNKVRDRC